MRPQWLPSLTPPQPWMEQAACSTVDPDLFFMVGDTPEYRTATRQAKRICRRCPVMDACLDYALKINDRHGIWGGLTPWERQTIRKDFA